MKLKTHQAIALAINVFVFCIDSHTHQKYTFLHQHSSRGALIHKGVYILLLLMSTHVCGVATSILMGTLVIKKVGLNGS